MEIERKFRIDHLPEQLEQYPHTHLVQGYLSTDPVVRVRQDGEQYILTYKGSGLMTREEYNLPLTRASYEHLLQKADGILIDKIRYRIPLAPYIIELDVFSGAHEGLSLAEVEFSSEAEAHAFVPPQWFGEEVTFDGRFHNSYLSTHPLSTQENLSTGGTHA